MASNLSPMTSFKVAITVSPGAKKTALLGFYGDGLKISIKSPPVDGAANLSLIKFVAELLEISPSHLTIVAGAKSRRKTVAVVGL
ncbi:MAG: DUF167 domain-containing protein, partial [Candidatus Adiutrix sp.]